MSLADESRIFLKDVPGQSSDSTYICTTSVDVGSLGRTFVVSEFFMF